MCGECTVAVYTKNIILWLGPCERWDPGICGIFWCLARALGVRHCFHLTKFSVPPNYWLSLYFGRISLIPKIILYFAVRNSKSFHLLQTTQSIGSRESLKRPPTIYGALRTLRPDRSTSKWRHTPCSPIATWDGSQTVCRLPSGSFNSATHKEVSHPLRYVPN